MLAPLFRQHQVQLAGLRLWPRGNMADMDLGPEARYMDVRTS